MKEKKSNIYLFPGGYVTHGEQNELLMDFNDYCQKMLTMGQGTDDDILVTFWILEGLLISQRSS